MTTDDAARMERTSFRLIRAAVCSILTVLVIISCGRAQSSGGRTPPDDGLDVGSGLYVTRDSVANWVRGHPDDPRSPAISSEIANQPMAQWLTGDESFQHLRQTVGEASNRNETLVLVTYNHAALDDGVGTDEGSVAASYSRFIDRVADTIGNTRAILILEVDALWFADRIGDARESRLASLRDAVQTVRRDAPRTTIYLDAGAVTRSVTPRRMAQLLALAGIANVRGFAVNTSSYASTLDSREYAREIRLYLRQEHGIPNARYVVDTSRNGNPRWDWDQWCNPAGRRLGDEPVAVGSPDGFDFKLWVKAPGTSDGNCGIGKGSQGGEFLPDVAYRMIDR